MVDGLHEDDVVTDITGTEVFGCENVYPDAVLWFREFLEVITCSFSLLLAVSAEFIHLGLPLVLFRFGIKLISQRFY